MEKVICGEKTDYYPKRSPLPPPPLHSCEGQKEIEYVASAYIHDNLFDGNVPMFPYFYNSDYK